VSVQDYLDIRITYTLLSANEQTIGRLSTNSQFFSVDRIMIGVIAGKANRRATDYERIKNAAHA
jgi:hypothetical protein